MVHKFLFNSSQALEEWAHQWAPLLSAGGVIYLYGNLGAGKTTFARGLLRGFGIQGAVKSPTYSLIECYEGPPPLYHLDLYRLGDSEEIEFLGIRDLFATDHVILIEWPERGSPFLPIADVNMYLHIVDEGRILEITTGTKRGEVMLEKL